MTDVYFYHLERQPLERVLPRMLQQSLDRGWRCVVQLGSAERVEALSHTLWSFEDDSFLPHGSKADGRAALQPVWLTDIDEVPNGATVRFFADGAVVGEVAGLTRAVVLFDGNDESAVAKARSDWKAFRAAGHGITYWQQDEQGRWQNRAGSQA